jgi:hypothetical protein
MPESSSVDPIPYPPPPTIKRSQRPRRKHVCFGLYARHWAKCRNQGFVKAGVSDGRKYLCSVCHLHGKLQEALGKQKLHFCAIGFSYFRVLGGGWVKTSSACCTIMEAALKGRVHCIHLMRHGLQDHPQHVFDIPEYHVERRIGGRAGRLVQGAVRLWVTKVYKRHLARVALSPDHDDKLSRVPAQLAAVLSGSLGPPSMGRYELRQHKVSCDVLRFRPTFQSNVSGWSQVGVNLLHFFEGGVCQACARRVPQICSTFHNILHLTKIKSPRPPLSLPFTPHGPLLPPSCCC